MRSRSSAAKVKSTAALVMGRGWQRGINSPVRLAAMMPAKRATSRTSPLAKPRSRMRASVTGAMRTRPLALASRCVSGLALVSTMRAAPCSSKCDNSLMIGSLAGFLPQQSHVLAHPRRPEEIEVVNLADAAAPVEQENTRRMIELSGRSRPNPHAPFGQHFVDLFGRSGQERPVLAVHV